MINLTIGDNSYELPEGWDEVTFANYIETLKVIEKQSVVKSATLKVIDQICAISGCKELKNDILKLSSDDCGLLIVEFEWLGKVPDYEKYDKDKKIEIDGEQYVLKQDYSQLSTDEMIIVEELVSSKKLDLHYFEIALGVLCRRLDADGNQIDISFDEFKNTIIKMRDKFLLKDIFPIVGFFLDGEKSSITKSSKSSSPSLTIMKANTQ